MQHSFNVSTLPNNPDLEIYRVTLTLQNLKNPAKMTEHLLGVTHDLKRATKVVKRLNILYKGVLVDSQTISKITHVCLHLLGHNDPHPLV